MAIHIVHCPSVGNDNFRLAGLPLFDWLVPAPVSRPSPRITRAHRIACVTGVPVGVVIAHLQAAGLGVEG